MSEKLITLVVLPYAKAHILKMRLGAKAIECQLEDVHLIEGTTATTVRVKILEKDINEALPELDYLLGLKPEVEQEKKEDGTTQVLVPVDFSEVAQKAARLAFNIATHIDAELVLMHSYISPVKYAVPYGDVYPLDTTFIVHTKEAEETAGKEFQKFVSALAEHIGKDKWEAMKPEYILKPGYANEDILAYAREHAPRLVVVGRGGDKSWPGTVGSVTADIMYNAPVPVLVVPEDMPDKKISEFREVLYATNFDAKDFVVLDKLMALLRRFNMNITCAHVGQPDKYGWDMARLEGMSDILRNKYKDKAFGCKLLMGNDVLQTLETYLEDENVDLLALTTHKRNMISRLFNPSLARKMVFHTHVPFLVFHA